MEPGHPLTIGGWIVRTQRAGDGRWQVDCTSAMSGLEGRTTCRVAGLEEDGGRLRWPHADEMDLRIRSDGSDDYESVLNAVAELLGHLERLTARRALHP